jgi:hypothetical protein
MTIIPRRPTPIKPSAIYAYFDKIQFWVLNPLDRKTIATLRRQCGRGGIYFDNRPARFDGRYRQRIELGQPKANALGWLAGHDDVLINRVEIAVDFIFKTRVASDEVFEFLHCHFVRRWHGKKQKIKVVHEQRGETGTKVPKVVDEIDDGETRYDAYRAPNKIVFYRNQFSRITGEFNCVHLEWHLNGAEAVRRVGINSGGDLLEFNHREFWQKRLLLFTVDRERLGRLNRNQLSGKRSRGGAIRQTGRINRQTGEAIVRAHYTVQELINTQRRYYRVHRALVPISNEGLLPE